MGWPYYGPKIYAQARKKIAELVQGNVLKIEGGEYQLCNGPGRFWVKVVVEEDKADFYGKNRGGCRMKIIVPVEDNKMTTRISQSFGRAAFFLLIIQIPRKKPIENSAAQAQGGAGIKAAQLVVDNSPDALLTPRCGQNAADVLEAANIKIYQTKGNDLMENIAAFKEGKLSILTEIHGGFHKHGGK